MAIMNCNMEKGKLYIPRVAILASGGGTTAEAYAEAIHDQRIEAEVPLLIASKASAGVLEKAVHWNTDWGFDVRSEVVGKATHPDGPRARGQSEETSTEICRLLDEERIDIVLQLGYMVIGNDPYVSEWGFVPERHTSLYEARALNWHPGLLPLTEDTYGAGASEVMVDAYLRGEIDRAGHTVHVVAQKVDGGPIVTETPVPIEPTDTADALFDRIQLIEKAVTPYVADSFIRKRREFVDGNS